MSETYSIILAIVAAGSAGLVGSFALMKRLALAGDVLSHVALPGLGLALLFGFNYILGGAATLFLGIILIWRLEKKTGLNTEVVIGVAFAAAVAFGAMITPEEELIEALFGGMAETTFGELILGLFFGAAVIYLLWRIKDRLIIGLFSADLAAATGINTTRLNLYFLLLFGLTIILGLKFLGALLMGALIIIPAAAARQLTHTLGSFLVSSAAISVASTVFGFIISGVYDLELGPAIVLIASAFFGLSLLKRKK